MGDLSAVEYEPQGGWEGESWESEEAGDEVAWEGEEAGDEEAWEGEEADGEAAAVDASAVEYEPEVGWQAVEDLEAEEVAAAAETATTEGVEGAEGVEETERAEGTEGVSNEDGAQVEGPVISFVDTRVKQVSEEACQVPSCGTRCPLASDALSR